VPATSTRPPQPEELNGLGAAVLDAFPVSLYLVNRDLRVAAWNRLREQGPIGKPRRKALGRPLSRLMPPGAFKSTAAVLHEVFRTGEPQEEFTEAHGRLFHIRRLPVRRGGEVTHVLSWFEDLTDRRALEMRLIASDRLAFLGQLVAGVAHEISNPLSGIAGCAEALSSLASKAPGTAREARKFRDLIREEVARSERIVRFLLDSARPSPGDTAELPGTVQTALKLLERHPAFNRIRVRFRVPDGLPAARIEAESLKQVVMALAMNAAQAMPTGGTLTLHAGRNGRTVTLDVIDTGPGVAASLRPHLFEPYFTTDPNRGAGLGLPVARSLLRSRGGDLVYRPRRSGSCFRAIVKAAGGGA
jgi:two-component system, NtrC family, sensor kinase